MADHGGQHEGQIRICRRHGHHVQGRSSEPIRFTVAGDDDRRGLVGPVNGDFLGDVVRIRTAQPGRADQDQRLARQVDVLFVLSGVTGNGSVAQLRQLDAHLGGCNAIGTAADHRPVAPGGNDGGRHPADRLSPGQHLPHGLGQAAQGAQDPVDVRRHRADLTIRGGLGQGPRHQPAGGYLGVERLCRRHAHLDVAPVRGVQDPVGFGGQIAVAPVDHRHHVRAAGPSQVDGAVGVGGRARLTDGDDERVAHVVGQPEAGQFGGGQGRHRQARQEPADGGRHGLAGHRRGPLTDDEHPLDRPAGEGPGQGQGHHIFTDPDGQPPIVADPDLAPQGLS